MCVLPEGTELKAATQHMYGTFLLRHGQAAQAVASCE